MCGKVMMMTIDDDDYDYHDYDDYRDYILTCVARWANDHGNLYPS